MDEEIKLKFAEMQAVIDALKAHIENVESGVCRYINQHGDFTTFSTSKPILPLRGRIRNATRRCLPENQLEEYFQEYRGRAPE